MHAVCVSVCVNRGWEKDELALTHKHRGLLEACINDFFVVDY